MNKHIGADSPDSIIQSYMCVVYTTRHSHTVRTCHELETHELIFNTQEDDSGELLMH